MRKLLKLCLGAVVIAAPSILPSYAWSAPTDITVVLETQPDQLDPCQSSKSQVGKVIKQNVVETLTEINPKNGQIKPRLATEWKQVDDLTWRFKLRHGVKFHDGTPFNAVAVKYSLERTLDKSIDCEIRVKYFGGMTITATPISDDEIEFKTNTPQPILPTLMGTVVAMSTATPMGKITREPIGTGPYKLAQWVPGERIVLERTNDYWGDKPKVTKATYIWRSESAVRAAMVASGEADISPNIAVQDATDPSIDFSFLNSETSRLRIDAAIPPLNDLRVRLALNYATDREGMKGTIFSKQVIASAQHVVPGINGHNPDLKPYPYDPAKAKALLKEAKAAGTPIDREIVLVGRYNLYPNSEESVQALQAMYEAVGLKVKLRMTESAEWYKLLFKPFAENRQPTLFQEQHDNNNGDAVFTIYVKYHSQGGQSTISDPELDKLIDEAGKSTGEKRTKLYQEAFKRIHEVDVPDVSLFHMVGFTRVNKRLDFRPSIATNSELQLSTVGFK
ncbi:MAG: peptide ABC transporter substrate-binding protein [Pseudonocardiaceae bacterium]|uniref:ABC transporter substrate-binding protein n=1 Tax=Afipia sp. 1NLS2 TaxID=666684 RepID=UPI0001DA1002|nr:ABC transporter substrate-binding protein [Afipia sp. 1NLS2]EFI52717.1 extracellular solute-binding protein family 5 [Afipia sp. 1NLS2]RTL65013.1 MAG: peptide ABC transporter substrate-binding protein [Pseudonocardiaceae bacterium]